MAARKMIQENGMSMKIIQFCNESKNFKKRFLEIVGFNNLGDVDYIEFTGDTPTPHGKPDITIRFNNGQYCIIEVKTDGNTDFQVSQTEGDGYVELIVEKNKVNPNKVKPHIESHFCFLLDPIHYDKIGKLIPIAYNNKHLDIPVISWEEIYQIVDDFGNRSLAKDIEENVSGIKKDITKDIFSAYDLSLLYNSELLYDSVEELHNFNFNRVDIVKNKLKNLLLDHSIINSLKSDEEDLRGCSFIYSNNEGNNVYGQIFLGFSPELLTTNKVISEKVSVEDFLCSVAVQKELVDLTKLNNVDYCEDTYRWIYIPVEYSSLQLDVINDINTVNFDNFVCSLDICHSLITLNRMSKLVIESKDKILDKLNKEFKMNFYINTYDKFYYPYDTNLVVGYYINTNKHNQGLYFGLTPNVFKYEKENTNIDELERPYYFSCVAIYDFINIDDKQGKFINKGKLFENGKSIYFPISNKNLCLDDFVEAYVKEVFRLITEAIKEYW